MAPTTKSARAVWIGLSIVLILAGVWVFVAFGCNSVGYKSSPTEPSRAWKDIDGKEHSVQHIYSRETGFIEEVKH